MLTNLYLMELEFIGLCYVSIKDGELDEDENKIAYWLARLTMTTSRFYESFIYLILKVVDPA